MKAPIVAAALLLASWSIAGAQVQPPVSAPPPQQATPQPPQSPKVAELIDALKAKNAVDQRILNAMGAIVQETGQIPALQKQIDDLTKARDGASRGLSAESARATTLANQITQLTQQKTDLEAQVKALTARLEKPKSKMTPADRRLMSQPGGLTNDQGQPLHLEPPAHR